MKVKHRLLIYYLSIYHEYLWIKTKVWKVEKSGNDYYNFWEDHICDEIPYSLLKRKRVHNLKYYDIEEYSNNIYDCTYSFKWNINLEGIGKTSIRMDMCLIKII